MTEFFMVYEYMRQLVERKTVVDEIGTVDQHGEPVLPSMPVFVVGNEEGDWGCRLFGIETWSPILSRNPLERERMIVKTMVWTKEDIFGAGV